MQINLGINTKTGKRHFIDSNVLKGHSVTIGSTRFGKSRFELLMIEALLNQCSYGGIVIDPHDSLVKNAKELLIAKNVINKRRIIHFRPSNLSDFTVGFNPIHSIGNHSDFHLSNSIMDSILRAFDQYKTTETPRLSRWLLNLILVLKITGRNLTDAKFLLNPKQNPVEVENILDDLESKDNPVSQMLLKEWRYFTELKSERTQTDLIEGVGNRLRNFLYDNDISSVINVDSDKSLGFDYLINNKKILLLDLKNMTQESKRLFGNLLISSLYLFGLSRTEEEAENNPFFVWIDEFQNWASREVAHCIEELGKFGIYFRTAFQGLYQVENKDDNDYLLSSFQNNAKMFTVFNTGKPKDVEELEKFLYAGTYNFKKTKDEIIVEKERTLQHWENIESITQSSSETETASDTTTDGMSNQYSLDDGYGERSGYNQTTNRTSTSGFNKTSGSSKTTTPTLVSMKQRFEEVSSRSFYSLDELRVKNQSEIFQLPRQHCLFKVRGETLVKLKVANVEIPALWDKLLRDQEIHQLKQPFSISKKAVVNSVSKSPVQKPKSNESIFGE